MLAVGRLMRRAIFQGNNTMDKLLIAKLPSEINSQNFKMKAFLKLRCKDCYFIRVDGRWEVKCSQYPRHHTKQAGVLTW
ncbi:unnamed protein product [Dracunculus medinensis]|uniref:Large ribosomal subunit protein bL36m n=1 Tax=Dracunculus medinensis TaxID=318479 RepID=A0A0N4UA17_DRAME|nr:unnamed protein product [Dracunculus medinensis]